MAVSEAASARTRAASLTSQLVKSNYGSARGRPEAKQVEANHTHKARPQQQERKCTKAMGLLLVAALMAIVLLAPPAEAKTHHSKRQAQQPQQQVQQQAPASGRDQTNWWNLWWQQYINEAQQPTVRPIVSVSFNGQTIDANQNFLNDIERAPAGEPAQMRQAKSLDNSRQQNAANWAAVKPKMFQLRQANPEQLAGSRANRQADDEQRPVIMMQQQQQQRLVDDQDGQINQIQLTSGRQPPPRPQLSSEFGIQMRAKPNRRQQASSSNQRSRQQQELERLRQLEQQRQQQQAIESEYLEQEQLQHQLSDYAEEAELEQNAIAQNATVVQPSPNEDNEVRPPNSIIDSSSSSMMMPERPRASTSTTSRQQETSSPATTTMSPATTSASTPAPVSGRSEQPSATETAPSSTTKRPPEVEQGPTTTTTTTTTTTAPGNRLQTGSPSSTTERQQQETSEATQPASSTTQTPLPMTTAEREVSETPVSIGGEPGQNGPNQNAGGTQGGVSQGNALEGISTTTQRQQPKQTPSAGQDRVELQNGRPATSGMMFVSGRPQLFGTPASTTSSPSTTTTSSGSTRDAPSSTLASTGQISGSTGAPASEQPKSQTASSSNVTMATTASDSEADSDDDSEDEQPGTNLNNSSGGAGDSAAGDSDSDGEEEEGDDAGETEPASDQTNAVNATSATSGGPSEATPTAGSGSSVASSSEPTSREPMLTTCDIEIERLPKLNESRGESGSQTSAMPSTATQTTKGEFARVTSLEQGSTAAPPSSQGPSQRQQQVLMMTVETSRGTLDGESAITVPMDAVMRVMMGQSQMGEQVASSTTTSATTQRPDSRQSATVTSTPPATTQTVSTSATSSTSGRLVQQPDETSRQTSTSSSTTAGQQPQSTPAATSTTTSTMTTRKKLQPPPTTRTPGSGLSSSTPAGSSPPQDGVVPMSQLTRQQADGSGATSAATPSSPQASSSSGADSELMSMTTSAMNLDDEAGGREPKIELLNMDLVPIQRIMNGMTSTTTSQPATSKTSPQQTLMRTTLSTMSPADMQQQAMNVEVEVEPGMRLRPPSSQQPRVTTIEQARPSTMRMQQQQQTSTSSRLPAVSVMPNQMNTVYMIMMPPEFGSAGAGVGVNNTTTPSQAQSELQMMIRNQEEQPARDTTSSQMKQMLAMLQTAAEQDRIKTQQQKQQQTMTSMRVTSQAPPAVTSARPAAMQTTMRVAPASQQTMTTSGQQLMRLTSGPTRASAPASASAQTGQPAATTTTTARPRFVSKEEFLETVRGNQPSAGSSDRSPVPRMQTSQPSSQQQTTMAPLAMATLRPAGDERRTSTPITSSTDTGSSSSNPASPAAAAAAAMMTTTTGKPAAATTMAPPQPLMVVVQLQNGTRVATPVSRMQPSDTLAALRQGATSLADQRAGQTTQSGGQEVTSTTVAGGQQQPQRPAPSRRPAGAAKTILQKTSAQNATGSFIPAKLRQDFGLKPVSQTLNEISSAAGARKTAKITGAAGEQRQANASLPQQQQDATRTTTPSPMVQSMAIRQFGGANRMSALAQQPVAFGRPATMMIVPASSPGARLQQYPAVPSFEYGPSIAVRRPDEPLANGQMPNCTLTGKNFCVLTKDYPMNEVRQAVERSFRSVRIMYEELQTVSDQELHKEDFKNATSSQAASGQFACQTQVEMMRPGWAKDEITREWMLVVNTDVFPQRVRTESCAQPNTPCEFIAPFYDSTCQQRYSLHRMIAIDPHDPTRSPQVAVFKFPAGCVCRVHPIRKGSSTQAPVTPIRQTTTIAPTTTTNVPSTTINVATSTSIRRRR